MKESSLSVPSYKNKLLQIHHVYENNLSTLSMELMQKLREPLPPDDRKEIEHVFEKTIQSAKKVFSEITILSQHET